MIALIASPLAGMSGDTNVCAVATFNDASQFRDSIAEDREAEDKLQCSSGPAARYCFSAPDTIRNGLEIVAAAASKTKAPALPRFFFLVDSAVSAG
jgi:hypothetical protein